MSEKPKARHFGFGMTLAEVNLVARALRAVEGDPAAVTMAKALQVRLDKTVRKQMQPKPKPPPKPGSRDAMHKRLPGSFESSQR
jgi:hypothetical protein